YTKADVERILADVHPADPIRCEARTKEVAVQFPPTGEEEEDDDDDDEGNEELVRIKEAKMKKKPMMDNVGQVNGDLGTKRTKQINARSHGEGKNGFNGAHLPHNCP